MSERDAIRQGAADDLDARSDDVDTVDRDESVHVGDGAHLQRLVDEGGVVLADFYADWCGPCKIIEPIVPDVAAETDATVAKVDVDEHADLPRQYQVQGVPTMYRFADGEPVERMFGVREKGDLVSQVERLA